MPTVQGVEKPFTEQVTQPLAQAKIHTSYTQNSASSIDTPAEKVCCFWSVVESLGKWLYALWEHLVHFCCGSSAAHHTTAVHAPASDFQYLLQRHSYQLVSNCFQGTPYINPNATYLGIIHFLSADGGENWRKSYFFSNQNDLGLCTQDFATTARCGLHDMFVIEAHFAQKDVAHAWQFYLARCEAHRNDNPEPHFSKLRLSSSVEFKNIITSLDPETQKRVQAGLDEA